jgi:hypothetical protein
MFNRIIRYFLENRIITVFLLLMVILGGTGYLALQLA